MSCKQQSKTFTKGVALPGNQRVQRKVHRTLLLLIAVLLSFNTVSAFVLLCSSQHSRGLIVLSTCMIAMVPQVHKGRPTQRKSPGNQRVQRTVPHTLLLLTAVLLV
jgi:hypothetical protein